MGDPIRARLDEHHMHRGHCIGCVRRFGGVQPECNMRPELDALRAVLDLCDVPANKLFCLTADEVRRAIADALGVEP